jgi:hypothetical protein
MKKTLITLSLLIGLILAIQAQLNIGLPQTLTYNNAPDSIKASLFSTNGTAMSFDSLYITVGTPWTETVNFYHSSRYQFSESDINSSTYTFKNEPTATTGLGRRPKNEGIYYTSIETYKDALQNNPDAFEPTNDGFLYDNKREEHLTLYYGWHTIKRTRTYIYKQTREAHVKKNSYNIPFIGEVVLGYDIVEDTKPSYTSSNTTTYEYINNYGETTPKIHSNEKPNNEIQYTLTESEWQQQVSNEVWTPFFNADETYYNTYKNRTPQQKTITKIYTDILYIWATKEEIENHNIPTNDEIEARINAVSNNDGRTFNQTDRLITYDKVGQVRHHFIICSPEGKQYKTHTYDYDYYDITWYHNNNGSYAITTATTNSQTTYHEYDTGYSETGKITQILNGGKSEYYSTIINKKPAVAMLIYAKKGNEFQYVRTANPCTQRAGRITNKKIYIHAYVDNLHWNSGDYLGWMQPVNCDIYLDNARLSAANNEELFTVYDFTKQINGDGGENSLEDFSCVYKKASVFYLPENSGNTTNTSTIHLRGKNYLGGNMAGRPKINMDVMGSYSGATVYIPVRYVMSNFSAPIAIKDKKLFTEDGKPNLPYDKNKVWETNIPQITCQIDATWADGNTQSDGYLDLSTRTSTIQDVTKGPLSDGTYHMANRCDVIDGYSEMSGDKTIYPTRIWGYSYLPHLRYEAPLVTGGEHGTFIINGGQINLWPANAYTLDGYIQRSPLAYVPILGGIGNMILRAGKSTNYMACGNTSWILSVDGSKKEIFNESSDGILTFFTKAKATCSLYGIGDGLPEGNLIVN